MSEFHRGPLRLSAHEGVVWALELGRFVACVDAYNGTGDFYGRSFVVRARGYGLTLGWSRPRPHWREAVQYHFVLCCNCGEITPYTRWDLCKYDYEGDGRLVPIEPGDMDPIMICPFCDWHHIDDDSGPGIYEGSYPEMDAEREAVLSDYREFWAEERYAVGLRREAGR